MMLWTMTKLGAEMTQDVGSHGADDVMLHGVDREFLPSPTQYCES